MKSKGKEPLAGALASDGIESIESLQRRYGTLNADKIRAETELKTAEKELERLRKEARDKYGVDDVDQLKALLTKMTEENRSLRETYQKQLDKIESDLKTVEAGYAALDGESSTEIAQ